MVKVNFKALQVKTSLKGDQVVTVDAVLDVANIIYVHGMGLASHALALKIYNSTGEVELTDTEASIVEEIVNRILAPRHIDAIMSQLKTKE